ncbi:SigE family RNA polymerase sigma factor [Nakamurella silvestris]|nr:SigE family RNA polymerase sigma factor [Nakamurella silvestris]
MVFVMKDDPPPDSASCEALYEQFLTEHLPGLARYARMLAGNREDAHDVLADTLVKVQNAWPRIVRMEYPLAYVRRILANTVISSKRRWSHRHITLTVTGMVPESTAGDATGQVDRLDELQQLLLTLTHRQRSMIVMRYYLDLSDQEIASQLRCSQVTVRATISRALGSLRIIIQESPEEPEPSGVSARARELFRAQFGPSEICQGA